MEWFLYENGLRHERVNAQLWYMITQNMYGGWIKLAFYGYDF